MHPEKPIFAPLPVSNWICSSRLYDHRLVHSFRKTYHFLPYVFTTAFQLFPYFSDHTIFSKAAYQWLKVDKLCFPLLAITIPDTGTRIRSFFCCAYIQKLSLHRSCTVKTFLRLIWQSTDISLLNHIPNRCTTLIESPTHSGPNYFSSRSTNVIEQLPSPINRSLGFSSLSKKFVLTLKPLNHLLHSIKLPQPSHSVQHFLL